MFFPRGEVLPPERMLDPIIATELGDRILNQARIYCSRDRFVGPNTSLNIEPEPGDVTSLVDGSNAVVLTHSDFAVVQFCESVFRSRLPEERSPKVEVDFYVGTVVNGRWHIDMSRDVRAVVNLSAAPIGLEVATEWDPKDYGKAESKYNYYAFGSVADPSEPKLSKTILYGPGEAIGVNNLARADRQVPHKALAAPGRVVMRLFATLE